MNKRPHKIFSSIVIFLMFALLPTAWALPTDKDQVTTISADTAQINHLSGISIFTGDVKVIQGTTVLTAKKLITYSNKAQKITKATALGNPAHYHTLQKKGDKIFYASAKKIDYYPTTGKVYLMGDGKLNQGKNSLAGPYLIYNKTDNILISKPSAGKRTTIILEPQEPSKKSS